MSAPGLTIAPVDPAALVLLQDLKRHHSRLAFTVEHLDPTTVPQGVADALHDSLAALADALQLQEALSWGWNG